MPYNKRLQQFQQLLEDTADVAFFPASADLHYLTGVPRDIPNFGTVMHPGGWLEGAWLSPTHSPVLTLSRMSAELGGLNRLSGIDMRVLGEWDDPTTLVKDILKNLDLPAKPRVAISDRTSGETISALHSILPAATFISASKLLGTLRVVKSEDEIDIMRRAGEITEAAFRAV